LGAIPTRKQGLNVTRSVCWTLTVALAAACLTPAARAAGLEGIWQAAAQHDKTLAVHSAAHAAAQPRRDQAAALWRPKVALSTSIGIAGSDTSTQGAQFSAPGFGTSQDVAFATSINRGVAGRVAVTLAQPLYNPLRRAQQLQIGLSVDVTEVQWQADRQALMLRTAERYFDLALAEETLRVQQRQLEAVQRAGEEAQDRFKIGAAPVTDTYEAQARLGGMRAQRLAADIDLRLKRQGLADSSGLPADALQARLPLGPMTGLPAPELDTALASADAGNPGLRMRRLAQDIARQEAAQHSLRASVTVDVVAQLAQERLSGPGDFGSASNRSGSRSIGLLLNLPLFDGGARDARQQESLRLADQAAAEVDSAREQVAQQVRAAWLGLSAGSERVAALAQALHAAEARNDATALGREVGHRTTLDLLNAENDRAAAQLALAQARVARVMEHLRLAALAGALDESALRAADDGAPAASRTNASCPDGLQPPSKECP
jgi:outer membrane protein